MKKVLRKNLRELAKASAEVATFCDHYEHSEMGDPECVVRAGITFLNSAKEIAEAFEVNLTGLYEERLKSIESRNVHSSFSVWSINHDKVRRANRLRELQEIQANHDRYFHPDVFGMSKYEQIVHYSFHLSKIVGAVSEACSDNSTWDDFKARRLPDMFLFGLKLVTVMGHVLPDELPAPQSAAS